jgi:aldose 1-epimerase
VAARDVRRLGGFVLAPFCNRLEGGRFSYDGVVYHVPLNWPADPQVAIHGVAWERPWAVARQTKSRLELRQRLAGATIPFSYDAHLIYDVSDETAVITLSIANAGAFPMPFGLGFHPYCTRTPGAIVQFTADGWLEPDARCFPVRWRPLDASNDARDGLAAKTLTGLDASFTGWTRRAALIWPELRARLIVEASESAKALHVYVPRGDASFACLEPVTHVIDVLNRRDLARYGDMVRLEPGAELSLSMAWQLQADDAR